MAAVQGARRSRREVLREAIWLTFVAIMSEISLAALAAIAALLLFIFVADGVAEGQTRAIDEWLSGYFLTHQPVWLHQPLLGITWLANGSTLILVITLAGLILVAARRIWPDLVLLLFTTFGGWGLVELIKAIYERPRPPGAYAHGYSFPSGHSFLSLTVYGIIAYFCTAELKPSIRRWVWGAIVLMAMLVGSTRVLLGAHYPSDVLAGFMGGAAWLWGCLVLRKLISKKDWGEWRESRINRLNLAYQIMSETSSERPRLETALHAWRPAGGLSPKLVKWAAKSFDKLMPRRWGNYDLIVTGAALRTVKGWEDTELAPVLKRLKIAQRGLFGLTADDALAKPDPAGTQQAQATGH